ncbi:MAG TPA: GNAT family N-acetyltransferase [Rhizomicrobium sp.]|nr:GNAT family N-acetyltransferase [Rhizomicrobium sp.]
MADFEIKQADSDADIRRCFPVMQVLRPHLTDADDLTARVRRMQAQGHWSLIYVEDKGEVVACSGFRLGEWLAYGRALYVDDLVCLESHRGQGFAESLMRWMEDHARAEGCEVFHLDSGTHRLPAHRFYHRLGMGISSFHFIKKIAPKVMIHRNRG